MDDGFDDEHSVRRDGRSHLKTLHLKTCDKCEPLADSHRLYFSHGEPGGAAGGWGPSRSSIGLSRHHGRGLPHEDSGNISSIFSHQTSRRTRDAT